ncbi:MAG TPA: aldehyde dehydrogenase, partial [Mollicutes bacterium]|nr:aldehyde dehydrogenase [Mollicutes bacterium]
MAVRVAINGFGRIGRLTARILLNDPAFELVAINDLTGAEDLAYLLKYDTTQGRFMEDEISFDDNGIFVGDKKILVLNEKDPSMLPWGDLNIDIVFECTGIFVKRDKAIAHINAGAKHVVISAAAGKDVKTIVYNVNHDTLDGSEDLVSTASCTTNCLAPVLKLLDDNFGVEKGFMTTVHAYTNDQVTLDIAHRKGIYSRRGRSAAQNIIPTTTGAASAIGLVIPSLNGKMDGISLRVPVATGSVVDLSVELKENVTVEDVNRVIKENANETLRYTEQPLVSSDIIGTHCGALVDGLFTNIVESDG